MRRYLTMDPGLVSGIAFINVENDGSVAFSTSEIPGGPRGLIDWLDDQVVLDPQGHWDLNVRAVAIEDFVVRQNTGRMTGEDIRYAMEGSFMAKGYVRALEVPWEKIHLIGASEHKTFSGVNGPVKGNVVRALDLAPKTKDGHAMDAASLGLQLLRREEPEAFDHLLKDWF